MAPSNRGDLASKVDLEEPLPSSPGPLPRAREAQEGVLLCSKSLSLLKSPVKTTQQQAALLNSSAYSIHTTVIIYNQFNLIVKRKLLQLTSTANSLFFYCLPRHLHAK